MWYDLVVVGILLYTTVRGAQKGVIWQFAAVAGLVLCLVFAETLSAVFGPYVHLEPPLNHWVVMIVSYLVFSALAFGLARLLDDWIEKAKFGEYNRHLGAIFGFVKGVTICLILTFFIVTVSEDARDLLRHSRSGHAAAIVMDRIHPVMPEKIHDALEDYIHQLDSDELDLRYAGRHHHGDEHEHDHSGHDHAGQGSAQLPSELEELVERLPPDLQGEFRAALLNSLNQAESETRNELEDRLREALESIRSVDDLTSLRETLSRPPDQLLADLADRLSTPADSAAEQRRQELLADISSVFSSYPQAQRLIQEDIERELQPLPDRFALELLEDWRADLWATPDPNPATGMATPLSVRIAIQLAAAAESEAELR